jgi:hypothetical protein
LGVNWSSAPVEGKGRGKGDTDMHKGKGKNMVGKGKGYGVAYEQSSPARLPTKRARQLSHAAPAGAKLSSTAVWRQTVGPAAAAVASLCCRQTSPVAQSRPGTL